MIAEAIDTVWTLGWALLIWIILLGVVAGLIVYAVVVVVWCTVRGTVLAVMAARRRLYGRVSASGIPSAPPEPRDAPESAQARPAPSWARTDHHDLEEAA